MSLAKLMAEYLKVDEAPNALKTS